MSDERPPGVLDSLPHSRPHRRSQKRAQVKPAPDVPETPRARAEAAATKASAGPPGEFVTRRAAAPKRASKPTPAPRPTPKPKPTKPKPKQGQAKVASRPEGTSPPGPKPGLTSQPPAAVAGEPEASHGPLETALGAAAELAEIGLHASARALRGALSRLPRP